MLPAFDNARRNSSLAALVSGDASKLRRLGARYGVTALYGYEDFERCLEDVDAVYIALPNSQHRAFTERAARAGVHVLCEKPLAMTAGDCIAMIEACREARVKLMCAYRLHFEKANLEALETVRAGRLGEPRLFTSLFTHQVEAGNLRLRPEEGGTLYDIGIYCLNAARQLFGSEPEEALGRHVPGDEARFRDVPEATSVILRFPQDRLAAFVCSAGAADVGWFEVAGTKASMRLEPAYGIAEDLVLHVVRDGKKRTRAFRARDQFAPELLYFSDCIRQDKDPEPSGAEGLADVRVLEAIERSAREARPVELPPFVRTQRPGLEQEISRPLPAKPRLVKAQDPTPES